MECLARPLELVDMAMWVSMVEWMDGLDMDMPEWVEGTKEVPVGSVDWARCPTEM
jgi:hypothetical protein